MDNQETWGPVERCISKHMSKPAITIAHELRNQKLLPEGTDLLMLSDKFEEAIKTHHEMLAQGFCGQSLPSRLANLI